RFLTDRSFLGTMKRKMPGLLTNRLIVELVRCPLLFSLVTNLFIDASRAQSANQKTYCNPVDIDYRYNFEQEAKNISYRSGADPVVVNHRGEYYLFVTISGGWWHSKDLLHWQFVTPNTWPKEDMCAPAALSVGKTLYLFQSTFDRRPI